MKKLIVLLLFSAIIVFSDQVAVTSNDVEIILHNDGSWMVSEIPDDVEFPISPFVITEDSQLVLLREGRWEYISPDDTIGASYQTIIVPVVPYYLLTDKKPNVRFIPSPKYPEAKSTEGMTVVKVLIDTDGTIMDVDILKSSDYIDLDQAAIEAAWQARFSPAIQDGKPVRVWVSIPFTFKLTDN